MKDLVFYKGIAIGFLLFPLALIAIGQIIKILS